MTWKHDRVVACTAWISVCMLSAAWGSLMDDTWRQTWATFGMFGLTAAVGLSSVSRMQSAVRDAKRNRVIEIRCRERMTRFERQVQSNDAIRDAVTRILGNFQLPTNEARVMANAEQDPRQRISCYIPVELIVHSHAADASRSVPTAIIRDLSSTSVGLAHDQRIDCERLTARVTLDDGEQIQLSLSLLWERKWEGHKGWYVSGGKILEVESTKDSEGQPCLAGASSDGLGG